MARKKKNQDPEEHNEPAPINNSGVPSDFEDEHDENALFEDEDEDSEDKGIDEILGGATLGRAASDLDGWGSEDYEN